MSQPETGPPLAVAHVLAPGRVGGLETVVRLLAGGLAARGHQVHVICVCTRGHGVPALLGDLDRLGLPRTVVEVPHRAYLREHRYLGRALARLEPDIVHTHGYRADVLGGSAATRLGIPTLSTVHGFTGGGWRNRFYEWLQVRAYRRFGKVVAVSRPLAEQLVRAGVHRDLVAVVPNSWAPDDEPYSRAEARRRLGIADGPFRLGWVGRLSPEKGADLLLRALGLASDLPLAASFVGGGAEGPRLEQLARELGVADRVTWHGIVPDAARLFAAFDAFVLSSRTEGTPISLFEAMAARVPVIATSVGGVPDVVGPGEALLVRPESPEALAAALNDLLRAPEAAQHRAAAAARHLEQAFALEPWLRRHEFLYRSLLPD